MNNARIASLLRRNAWWMDLGFIGWVMYFLASTCNGALAWAIGRVPTVDDVAVAPTELARGPGLHKHQPIKDVAERNLFALRREVLVAPAGLEESSAEPKTDLTLRQFNESDLQACSVNATVRGTLVAQKPEWSVAIIVRNDTHEPSVLSAVDGHNEIFEDARVVAIRSREVIVRRRDHFERCQGDGDSAAAPATQPSGPPVPHEEGGGSEVTGVTKISSTDYKVERAEVDRALANLNEVATQARIVPSFKNGRANGFKMFSIKRGSIYDKIGLQNGDVIQKINGYEMNSPDRALEIYSKLSNATSLSIEMMRGNAVITLNYAIN